MTTLFCNEPDRQPDRKMPQCPKHRLFYPFGGKCLLCVVEEFEANHAS